MDLSNSLPRYLSNRLELYPKFTLAGIVSSPLGWVAVPSLSPSLPRLTTGLKSAPSSISIRAAGDLPSGDRAWNHCPPMSERAIALRGDRHESGVPWRDRGDALPFRAARHPPIPGRRRLIPVRAQWGGYSYFLPAGLVEDSLNQGSCGLAGRGRDIQSDLGTGADGGRISPRPSMPAAAARFSSWIRS